MFNLIKTYHQKEHHFIWHLKYIVKDKVVLKLMYFL